MAAVADVARTLVIVMVYVFCGPAEARVAAHGVQAYASGDPDEGCLRLGLGQEVGCGGWECGGLEVVLVG